MPTTTVSLVRHVLLSHISMVFSMKCVYDAALLNHTNKDYKTEMNNCFNILWTVLGGEPI